VENSLYKDYFEFSILKAKDFKFNVNAMPESISKDKRRELEFGLTSFQDRYKIKDELFQYQSALTIRTTCMTNTPYEKITFRTTLVESGK
jgi:preprotein translocase subunit SecB